MKKSITNAQSVKQINQKREMFKKRYIAIKAAGLLRKERI